MALHRTSLSSLLAIVLVAAACSSEPDVEPVVERGPDQLSADAAAAMTGVESASFTIEQSGGSIFIDDNDQIAFQSARGRFARPASSEAVITVDALGFTAEVGAVAIDGELWITDPLTGEWTEAPESFAFDPATLFDPDDGFPALLTEGSASARLVTDPADPSGSAAPEADDDEDDRYHLRTTAAASRVSVLTGGLVNEESEVDLWIDPDTDRVVEVRFDVQLTDAVSRWRMTLGDYDAEVTISRPELGPEG